jgi:hypothetical protein
MVNIVSAFLYLLVGRYHALLNTKHRALHPLVSGSLQCSMHVTLFASTQAEDPKSYRFIHNRDLSLSAQSNPGSRINFVVFSVTRDGRNSPFLELPEKPQRNGPNHSIAILLL